MARKGEPNVADLLVDQTIKKLAWRSQLRAREIRAEARRCWQDKKRNAQLKFRASQFDDLSVMIRELLDPEQPAVPDLKLGKEPPGAAGVPGAGEQDDL